MHKVNFFFQNEKTENFSIVYLRPLLDHASVVGQQISNLTEISLKNTSLQNLMQTGSLPHNNKISLLKNIK